MAHNVAEGVQRKMFGSFDCWAVPRGDVRGFTGAVEEKAVVVCRAPGVPTGYRVGQPGHSRIVS